MKETDTKAQNILADKTAKLGSPESVTEVNSSMFGSEEQTALIINRMPGHIHNNAQHPHELTVTVQMKGTDTTFPQGSQKKLPGEEPE